MVPLGRAEARAFADRSAAGRATIKLLERPRNLLVTILIGNLIVNIFATSAATAVMLSVFGERGVVYAFVVMSVLIMTFGEIFPKAIAFHWPEAYSTAVVWPLRIFHVSIAFVRSPLAAFATRTVDVIRRRFGNVDRFLTWEELVTALRIGKTAGAVGMFEYEILANVLSCREKIVREIMTPSIDVVSRPVTSERGELLECFLSSGMSRIPICGETPDDVLGVRHIKDLLAAVDPDGNDGWLRGLLRPALFVPETTPIVRVYRDLKSRQSHLAVVIDEFGSFVGVVTIEDVLEELVGEIYDESDQKPVEFVELSPNKISVDGTAEVRRIEEHFGIELPGKSTDTINRWLLDHTERIPITGETFVLDDFEVLGKRITRRRMQ